MIKKLLVAIALLLHIGLVFAQNSIKPPPSPFSFSTNGTSVNNVNALPSAGLPPVNIVDSNTMPPALPNDNAGGGISILSPKKSVNNITEKVLNKFKNKIHLYTEVLIKASLQLLMLLTSFMILMNIFKFALEGRHNLNEYIANIIVMALTYKFFSLLIISSGAVSDGIINWFRSIAVEATKSSDFRPSVLLDLAGQYFIGVIKSVFLNFNVVKSMTLIGISGITSVILALMVAFYIVAVIEGLLLSKISVLMLGFSTFSLFKDMGFKPINVWIYIGLKLMFLQLIIGLEIDLLRDFLISVNPDIADCVAALFVSIIMLVVTWRIPKIFENLINGSSSIGGATEMLKAIAKHASSFATGGVLGSVGRQLGGAQQAIQAHERYQNAQNTARSQSSGIYPMNSDKPTSMDSVLQRGNQNSSSSTSFINNQSTTGANNTTSQSTQSNTGFNSSNNNDTSSNASTSSNNSSVQSDINKNAGSKSASTSSNNSTNSNANNTNASNNYQRTGVISGIAQGAKEMAMQGIKDSVAKTAGGRLAQHFDNKTKALETKSTQEQIDNHYKKMWEDIRQVEQNKKNNPDTSNNATNIIEKFTSKFKSK